VIAVDTGLVGSMKYQAERDRLPDGHPLRLAAARMDAALQRWVLKQNDPVVTAQLQVTWASTKLAWQQYLENRYDPEPKTLKRRASLSQVQE
jgi:hypothetical protein